jgi:nucleotide-binding universal stress UspA family protein
VRRRLSNEDRARLDRRIEFGYPDLLLREIVQRTAVDLVVLATQLAEIFLGSVAKRIVALLPCDALVVPAKST